MRTYLVVVDETREAEIALRFAARRAAGTGGAVTILSLIPPAEFLTWSGVQATMEDEAHQRAEALIASAVGTLMEESGIKPQVRIEQGEPIATIRRMLDELEGVRGAGRRGDGFARAAGRAFRRGRGGEPPLPGHGDPGWFEPRGY